MSFDVREVRGRRQRYRPVTFGSVNVHKEIQRTRGLEEVMRTREKAI
jgi:hypothetical protein